jgi:hypothetical protein
MRGALGLRRMGTGEGVAGCGVLLLHGHAGDVCVLRDCVWFLKNRIHDYMVWC